MNKKTLHMIGNAHIDPVWLWQWQEGFHEVKASFRSALDRMKTFDDFIFVASSAAFYEWVEHSDPAMFAEIQTRVKEGRWNIVGGWWVEPDCNIPSGESFVRHSLYGQGYFQEKFGVIAKTGFNIDSFGHAGSLPQILQKSGIENYVFLRPGPHEKELPARLFIWEAPDGSRVTAFQIPTRYNSTGEILVEHIEECAAEITAPLNQSMCFYGVGNHGGGPTIENIQRIQEINHNQEMEAALQFSSPDHFFEQVNKENLSLPLVADELQHHASGCYAVHSGIKQWNRQAENLLVSAEKWSVLADHELGLSYPSNYPLAWKQLLFNQFHDIMAGTSLECAYEAARDQIGETKAIAARNKNAALQALAWNINIPEQPEAYPIVAFNPLTSPTTTLIELETNRWPQESVLVDETNTIIPHQSIQSQSRTRKVRLCFSAELPALGYRTYRLVTSGPLTEKKAQPSTLTAADTVIENNTLRLEINPINGTIASLFDKVHQVEIFSTEAAQAVVLDDPGDTWAHGVFRWDQLAGIFRADSVFLVESGPVKATIRAISSYGHSKLIQEFSLTAAGDQIDVKVSVDWHEHFKMLKLRFPINVNAPVVTAENAYGHIQREPNGNEESMQRWVDVTGKTTETGQSYGLSLLNDAKYSYDVNQNDLGLTILRSPVYAHHIPTEVPAGGFYSFMDQGMQHFNYSLVPHDSSWKESKIVQRAEALNQPASALFATFHSEGKLPQRDSFLSIDTDAVMVTALKQSEDGNAFILRAVEIHGKPIQASISLPFMDRKITAKFSPFEIKTIRVSKEAPYDDREVNLLEK